MNYVTIDTQRKFEHWLSENGWFEDCRVISLTPMPTAGFQPLPSSVAVVLASQIEGNYKAYSTRVSKSFRLVADGIREYNISEAGSFDSENICEGIKPLHSENAISFCLDIPATLTLSCKSMIAEELPDLVETVKPWLSDIEVYAKIPATTLPTPTDWVALFKTQNQDVAWHIYGDEPRNTDEVPLTGYAGWFLQYPQKSDLNHQGIFFFSAKPDGNGFTLFIKNHGASDQLWHAAMIILGQFSDIEVQCGNCEFQRKEWQEKLEFLPTRKSNP